MGRGRIGRGTWARRDGTCLRQAAADVGGREVGEVLAEEGEELAMGLGADELSVQCALHGLVPCIFASGDSIGTAWQWAKLDGLTHQVGFAITSGH